MKGLGRQVSWVVGLALALVIAAGSAAAPPKQWDYTPIEIEGPGGVTLRAWVFRPQGSGPFPAIVSLHGGSGVTESNVDRAAWRAREGFVSLTGCWSGPPYNPLSELGPALIVCPGVPRLNSPELRPMENAVALIEAARRQPGVRSDRIGVIGGSAGASVALEIAASSGVEVQAVVAESGRYDLNVIPRLEKPLLLLHARNDTVFGTDVEQAIRFADMARRAGKDVQIYIYDSGGHHFMFEPGMKEDVLKREVEFLNRYLRR